MRDGRLVLKFSEDPFGSPGYSVGLSIGIGSLEYEDDCPSFHLRVRRGELLQLPELTVYCNII